MRYLPALLAPALSFVLLTAGPAAADARSCGGNAPTVTTCWSAGTVGTTTITLGCRSATPAFSGYVIVRFTTATGHFTRTCYFANGNILSASDPAVTGWFVVGQSYWLDGDGVGFGGWQIYVNA